MPGVINSFSHGHKSGYVHINVTAANSTYMATQIDLLQSYMNPTWNIEVYRWSLIRGPTLLFYISIRTCEIKRFPPRNPFLNASLELAQKFTNFTLTCPLRADSYFVLLDFKSLWKIFPVRVFYQPETFIHSHQRFYEQAPKGNYTLLAEFQVNFIIGFYCWIQVQSADTMHRKK